MSVIPTTQETKAGGFDLRPAPGINARTYSKNN
jgi:hypothetical protein